VTLPSSVKASLGVLNVGLRRGHLPGVAVAEHAAQALLGQRCTDLADGRPDHRSGNVVERILAHGRDAQSMAFFNAPGIERLYSGVTNRTASEREIASISAVASGGYFAS
jgi:hypothetical protein